MPASTWREGTSQTGSGAGSGRVGSSGTSRPGTQLSPYTFGAVTRAYPEDLGTQSGSLSGNGTVTATQPLADGDKGRVYDYEVVGNHARTSTGRPSPRSDSRLVFSSDQLLGALISFEPEGGRLAVLRPEGRSVHPQGRLGGPGRKAVPLGRGDGQAPSRGLEARAGEGRGRHDRHALRAGGSDGEGLHREAGQAFRERPALDAEGRLVRNRAFRQGCKRDGRASRGFPSILRARI